MHPHQDRVALPDDSRHSPVRCCFVCLPCSWAGDALVWAPPCLEYKQPFRSAISPDHSRTLASALCPSSFSSPKGYFPLGSLQHLHTCPGHTISAGLVPTSWTEFCRSGPIRYLHCCCKPHPPMHTQNPPSVLAATEPDLPCQPCLDLVSGWSLLWSQPLSLFPMISVLWVGI